MIALPKNTDYNKKEKNISNISNSAKKLSLANSHVNVLRILRRNDSHYVLFAISENSFCENESKERIQKSADRSGSQIVIETKSL